MRPDLSATGPGDILPKTCQAADLLQILGPGGSAPAGCPLTSPVTRPDGIASTYRLSVPAGVVSVEYQPFSAEASIEVEVELQLHSLPDRLLLRFRTPQKQPYRSVTLDGRPHLAFQAESGDVELPPVSGKVMVQVDY